MPPSVGRLANASAPSKKLFEKVEIGGCHSDRREESPLAQLYLQGDSSSKTRRNDTFQTVSQGIEQFKEILRQTHTSFPDLQLSKQEVIGEEDRVGVFWSYQGTHQKGEVFGMAPTGKSVRVSGITRLRIHKGHEGAKVIEENGIVDNFSLMQQLSAQ